VPRRQARRHRGEEARRQLQVSAPQGVNLKKRDDVRRSRRTRPARMNIAQRDERRNRLAARSRQLLVTEIQGLESLFSSTPKNAPDRPKLMRRLAEGYVELESAAFRDKTENEHQGRRGQAPEEALVDDAGSRGAAKARQDPRRRARRRRSSTTPPQERSTRSGARTVNNASGCDEEHGLHGRGPLLPRLRIRAGERLRQRAQGLPRAHPQLAAVEVHPERVPRLRRALLQRSAGRPEQVGARGAVVRRGHQVPAARQQGVRLRALQARLRPLEQGRLREARISEFKKTIDFGAVLAAPEREQLAVSARRDIIPVYALKGDPKKAYDFFRPLSGDTGATPRRRSR
jgi:hypothetical protein